MGLAGGATSAAADASDVSTAEASEALDKNNSPIPSVSVKNLASQISDESDENQHKQKLLKFDNELHDAAIEKNIVNNNELCDAKGTRGAANLTQRSRLLNEIEQKIQNSLNQNVESAETAPTVKMDTEDNLQLSSRDSGIENMEVDDPAPASKMPVEVEVDLKTKQREAEIVISRILDAFWTDHCEGNMIVTATAGCYKDFIDAETDEVLYDDLAFQIVTEIIFQFFEGSRVVFKALTPSQIFTSTPIRNKIQKSSTAPNVERMDTTESTCAAPSLQPHILPDQGACSYLIQSFVRSTAELERYNCSKNQKKFGSVVRDVIGAIQQQLISTTVLILNGKMEKKVSGSGFKVSRSVLLDLLYEESVPFEFFRRLVEAVNNNDDDSSAIFGLLLNNLYTDMQSRVIGKKQGNKIDTTPVNILCHLTELTVDTASGAVVRPFCNLIAKMANFLPKLCTETSGREIVKASLLGPFLSISVLSEENPKLFEDEDDDWDVNSGIASHLQTVKWKLEFAARSPPDCFALFPNSNWSKCEAICTQSSTIC